MAIRVAVDAMGGDDAPGAVIEGTLRAVRAARGTMEVVLYGPKERLRQELRGATAEGLRIVDAPEVIEMGDMPVAAVRSKPRSSVLVGLSEHKQGRTDAFISAGNTGATVAASLFSLGRLPGVVRPAMPTCYPTVKGVCLVLDIGSNMDSKAEHLLQFARLGAAYCRTLLAVDEPTVGLLSVGEEPAKGNELVKAAHALFSHAPDLRFVGNIEGRDILHHGADVVVCDGFIGNVVLKLGESIATAIPDMVRQELRCMDVSAEVAHVMEDVFSKVAQRFNSEQYGGGVPLLGVDGTVFIMHGRSSASAIGRCIRMASQAATLGMRAALESALRTHVTTP